MDRLKPPFPSEFIGRRADFVCAASFWFSLIVGYLTFVGIRAVSLWDSLNEIDEIKEEGKQCDFPVPMLDICELGHEFSLLDVLSVEVNIKARDPSNSKALTQTKLVSKTFTEAAVVNLDEGIWRMGCEKGSKHCKGRERKIVYHCYRFDPARSDPPQQESPWRPTKDKPIKKSDHRCAAEEPPDLKINRTSEQVDGEYTIRVGKPLKEAGDGPQASVGRIAFATGGAPLFAGRLYQSTSGQNRSKMISGMFFRLSLAEDVSNPYAFEHELLRHVGVPYQDGIRIIDVLARPARHVWKDTLELGGYFGYKMPKKEDTWILDVSQFTKFETLTSTPNSIVKDPRLVLKFVLATTTVHMVEHINHVIDNLIDFAKDCVSVTIVFTVMAMLFTPARRELVEKRFFIHLRCCGLGRPAGEEEEKEEEKEEEEPLLGAKKGSEDERLPEEKKAPGDSAR